jgi:hypothetical protein
MTKMERTVGENELRPTSLESLERLLSIINWLVHEYRYLVESISQLDDLLEVYLGQEFRWTEVEEEAYVAIYKEMDSIMRGD